jgi:hypothetical protein
VANSISSEFRIVIKESYRHEVSNTPAGTRLKTEDMVKIHLHTPHPHFLQDCLKVLRIEKFVEQTISLALAY